jgi:hypothetical protein
LNAIAAKKSRCHSNFLSEHALFGSCAAQSFPVRSQRQEIRRNKQKGHGLSRRPAILSPSPRAWSVNVGAVDGPIGCALIFLAATLFAAGHSGGTWFRAARQTARRVTIQIARSQRQDECSPRAERRGDPTRRRMTIRENYAVACRSRGRALRPKNSAWLATAETTASWNGLAIRNAGSGRCPVRKRSG